MLIVLCFYAFVLFHESLFKLHYDLLFILHYDLLLILHTSKETARWALLLLLFIVYTLAAAKT